MRTYIMQQACSRYHIIIIHQTRNYFISVAIIRQSLSQTGQECSSKHRTHTCIIRAAFGAFSLLGRAILYVSLPAGTDFPRREILGRLKFFEVLLFGIKVSHLEGQGLLSTGLKATASLNL